MKPTITGGTLASEERPRHGQPRLRPQLAAVEGLLGTRRMTPKKAGYTLLVAQEAEGDNPIEK